MIIGKPTPKQEKEWLERITRYGQEHGEFPKQEGLSFDRHHVKGREFKHNKVAIGRWYVLPIAQKYHDIHSNNAFNVTHFKKRYEIEFGTQKDQFIAMCMVIADEDGQLMVPDCVMDSILSL